MRSKYSSTAKVIDGVLILSLPDAITPVVWQMELGQSKSSALEIRTLSENQFVLTLKTPRQDVLDIAVYDNRDQAIKALLVVSQAMEKAQGQLKSAPTENSYPVPAISYTRQSFPFMMIAKKIFKFAIMIIGAAIALGLVLFVAGKLFLGTSSPSINPSSSSNAPMSADEFLERR